MIKAGLNRIGRTGPARLREQARVRPLLLAVVGLITGLGIGAVWFYRAPQREAGNVEGEAAREEVVTLSAASQSVLQRLDSPIEIRYYSLLDPASTTGSLQSFAGRVDHLLSAYQQAANDKIKVTRFNPQSDVNTAAAAAADSLKPFNLDKGNACYLGLVLVLNGHKESFPQLSPEWETALESDLSRAITRLVAAASSTKNAVLPPPLDPSAMSEVKQQLPNFASVSMEEGSRVLRESALQDFAAAVKEMESQLQDASQRLSQAQNGTSATEQQAAMKHLQQVQAAQAEKLKQISAKSMAQIEALKQLKEAAR